MTILIIKIHAISTIHYLVKMIFKRFFSKKLF